MHRHIHARPVLLPTSGKFVPRQKSFMPHRIAAIASTVELVGLHETTLNATVIVQPDYGTTTLSSVVPLQRRTASEDLNSRNHTRQHSNHCLLPNENIINVVSHHSTNTLAQSAEYRDIRSRITTTISSSVRDFILCINEFTAIIIIIIKIFR